MTETTSERRAVEPLPFDDLVQVTALSDQTTYARLTVTPVDAVAKDTVSVPAWPSR